jgi:predicted component of type VI protein secretion system
MLVGSAMPAHLVALTEGPSILLDKPILLVGRHHECDVQIESRKISRRHCCIAQVNDYLVVRDLGSTNGIRINGTRVPEGRLAEQDVLTIGTLRYQVTWDAALAAAAPQHEAFAGDDSVLEDADEPVPLEEPGRPLPGRARRQDKPDKPPPSPEDASLIIPEQLELAPESFPSLPGQPSGSHPPG